MQGIRVQNCEYHKTSRQGPEQKTWGVTRRIKYFVNLQGPYNCNLMLAGYDEKTGPSLYLIDYLGTMHSMNMAGTGYGKQYPSYIPFISILCSGSVNQFWVV